jgi:hypothetical protein
LKTKISRMPLVRNNWKKVGNKFTVQFNKMAKIVVHKLFNGAQVKGTVNHPLLLQAKFQIWCDPYVTDMEAIAIWVAGTPRWEEFFVTGREAIEIAEEAIEKIPKFEVLDLGE